MGSKSKLRTLLLLGRTSNLPSVWSNCLAGWLLGGGGDAGPRFVLLCCGATSLYLGGMYLNDAFDAEFDAQHRRERPIPSGAITEKSVWRIGSGLLVLGLVLLAPLGWLPITLATSLAASILVYDAVHKMVAFSPVLMALCRLLLYILAASAAVNGVSGLAVWSAFALACYIMGLSYLARKESTGVIIQRWPLLLILVPVILALIVNDGISRSSAWAIGTVFLLWTARSLRSVWAEPRNVPRAVSGLLAGIVWVDMLAVPDESRAVAAAFVALFALAIGFQRYVPAT